LQQSKKLLILQKYCTNAAAKQVQSAFTVAVAVSGAMMAMKIEGFRQAHNGV